MAERQRSSHRHTRGTGDEEGAQGAGSRGRQSRGNPFVSQVPVKDGSMVHREPGTARCLWTQTTRFSSAAKPVIL